MLACMNIQQVSTLLNIGSKLVNLPITTVETVEKANFEIETLLLWSVMLISI